VSPLERLVYLGSSIALVLALGQFTLGQTAVGIFENHGDVGTVLHAGSVEYAAANRTYTISGSG
jgi:hypothetical protein